MKSLTWTHQALTAGGELKIKSIFPGKTYLKAEMSWPKENPQPSPVSGKEMSLSVEGALEKLEEALAEDAAQEMLRSGSV